MDIGKLKRKIQIKSPVYTTLPSGEKKITSWRLVAAVWAKIKTLSSSESDLADKPTLINTHEVTIRYLPALLSSHRIFLGTRELNISSVNNVDEADEWHILQCSEIRGK